jgi:hypothetical protein
MDPGEEQVGTDVFDEELFSKKCADPRVNPPVSDPSGHKVGEWSKIGRIMIARVKVLPLIEVAEPFNVPGMKWFEDYPVVLSVVDQAGEPGGAAAARASQEHGFRDLRRRQQPDGRYGCLVLHESVDPAQQAHWQYHW